MCIRLAHGLLSHEGDHELSSSFRSRARMITSSRPPLTSTARDTKDRVKKKRTTVTTKKRRHRARRIGQAGSGSQDFIHTCTLAFLGKEPHRPGSIALRFLKHTVAGGRAHLRIVGFIIHTISARTLPAVHSNCLAARDTHTDRQTDKVRLSD